jgi:hypothetical protein
MHNNRIFITAAPGPVIALIHMYASWSRTEPAALIRKCGTADFSLVSSPWLTTASSYRVSKLCRKGHIDGISVRVEPAEA